VACSILEKRSKLRKVRNCEKCEIAKSAKLRKVRNCELRHLTNLNKMEDKKELLLQLLKKDLSSNLEKELLAVEQERSRILSESFRSNSKTI
jgi:tRNA/tmRNA/rRNA uracil-C5-methylase (TrmA/RlmC/RlmD family)